MQVKFAAVLGAATAVLQAFVLVGLARQMVDDGICSPSSFFFLFVLGVFVVAAFLHPQVNTHTHLLKLAPHFTAPAKILSNIANRH